MLEIPLEGFILLNDQKKTALSSERNQRLILQFYFNQVFKYRTFLDKLIIYATIDIVYYGVVQLKYY